MGEDLYSPGQAAKILQLTDRHVRHMLSRGEIEGEQTAGGRWQIPQREIHRVLEERRRRATPAGHYYGDSVEATADAQEARELRLRVEDLTRELGRLEGRLELTERTESTMQAERDRLLEDRDRERERADRLEADLAELREAREASETRPGFWRRLFGGSGGSAG